MCLLIKALKPVEERILWEDENLFPEELPHPNSSNWKSLGYLLMSMPRNPELKKKEPTPLYYAEWMIGCNFRFHVCVNKNGTYKMNLVDTWDNSVRPRCLMHATTFSWDVNNSATISFLVRADTSNVCDCHELLVAKSWTLVSTTSFSFNINWMK